MLRVIGKSDAERDSELERSSIETCSGGQQQMVNSSIQQIPQVSISRFDLFHAHMFTDHHFKRIGILFHAKEYPAYVPFSVDSDLTRNIGEHAGNSVAAEDTLLKFRHCFEVNLGYCQTGSDVQFCPDAMGMRNFLFYEVDKSRARVPTARQPIHVTMASLPCDDTT
eukprot:gene8255-1524_t